MPTSADRGRRRLIVALDVESGVRAMELAAALRDLAGGFKIGSRLFTMEGPSLVRRLVDTGVRVFLDLKFHDIPNTVAQAVEAAVHTGAWMVNVHGAGGSRMLEAARRAAEQTALRLGVPRPQVIAVTVLTSMDETALAETGVARPLAEQVLALARMAQQAGLDGVVASPHEIRAIRAACGERFAVVTPGIRGAAAGDATDDQARTMGPGEAVAAGATYIVVGRPIIGAPDPRRAAGAVAAEIERTDAGGDATSR